ncbi:hypothetical protein [Shewanella algae]|uniref:hypothetical protein n=1 Tax=Shewanella algae TaxID=38313 RepID=UPI0031F51AA8
MESVDSSGFAEKFQTLGVAVSQYYALSCDSLSQACKKALKGAFLLSAAAAMSLPRRHFTQG